ncbi:MAG: TRAP transporter small permease [Spirochaetales bacterium]|jgi:TRAP-type C4-dicarboxylate transport system permease small subunit|nr:TRAP transporter small permease [Spirochaetales bacterium]
MENSSEKKSALSRALLKLQWLAETLVALILAVMVATVFIEVIMRYMFNSSITASEELARILFIWMVFIGIVLMLARGRHVAFDAIQEAASPAVKKILQAVTLVGIGIASCILAVYGYIYSEQNFAWPSAALMIPYGYISLILPVSGAAMLIITIVKLIGMFTQTKGDK